MIEERNDGDYTASDQEHGVWRQNDNGRNVINTPHPLDTRPGSGHGAGQRVDRPEVQPRPAEKPLQ